MTKRPRRDPRELPMAPPDDWWHRGAQMIDNAYAAASALNKEIKARRSAPAPPSTLHRQFPAHALPLDTLAAAAALGDRETEAA